MGGMGVKLHICVQLWMKILKQSIHDTKSGWAKPQTPPPTARKPCSQRFRNLETPSQWTANRTLKMLRKWKVVRYRHHPFTQHFLYMIKWSVLMILGIHFNNDGDLFVLALKIIKQFLHNFNCFLYFCGNVRNIFQSNCCGKFKGIIQAVPQGIRVSAIVIGQAKSCFEIFM